MRNIISIAGIVFFIYVSIDLYFFIRRKYKKKSDYKRIYVKSENSPVLYYHSSDGFTLCGIPDEICEDRNGDLFVIEYKSNLKKRGISDYYRYQLGAYFLCIEESYGRSPKFGILKDISTGKKIRLENDNIIKKETIEQAKEIMLIKEGKLTAVRNHNDVKRCVECNIRNDCQNPVLGI